MSMLLSGLVEKVKELSYREKLKLACIEEERLNSASQAEEMETIKKTFVEIKACKI